MSHAPLISVVVPVFNERNTIHEILQRITAVSLEKEIIVVDDGSTDGTTKILQEFAANNTFPAARYILAERNRGKGSALRTGVTAARGHVVIIQDADLEYDPAQYHVLLEPILSGKADVVYGSRFLGGPHRILFFWHSIGNQVLTLLSNMMTNLNLTDMETGYKVFRREIFTKITIEEDRFGFEPEITAKVAQLKCRIYEVPISYQGRDYSSGKKITWRDGVAALYFIVKYSILRRLKRRYFAVPLFLFVCVATAFNLNLFERHTRLDRSYDDVSSFERSLAELRLEVPKEGIIGYVSGKPAGDALADPEQARRYYLTQYTLSPLVVEAGRTPNLVIGDFAGYADWKSATAGLTLVRDFGNGLMLFRK